MRMIRGQNNLDGFGQIIIFYVTVSLMMSYWKCYMIQNILIQIRCKRWSPQLRYTCFNQPFHKHPQTNFVVCLSLCYVILHDSLALCVSFLLSLDSVYCSTAESWCLIGLFFAILLLFSCTRALKDVKLVTHNSHNCPAWCHCTFGNDLNTANGILFASAYNLSFYWRQRPAERCNAVRNHIKQQRLLFFSCSNIQYLS